MANLKEQLIHLGHQDPDLREHLRPIIDKVSNKRDDAIKQKTDKVYDSLSELSELLSRASLELDDPKYDNLYDELEEVFRKFDQFVRKLN